MNKRFIFVVSIMLLSLLLGSNLVIASNLTLELTSPKTFGWYNGEWGARQIVTIIENTGNNLISPMIRVPWTAGMNPDFSDLRFTDLNNTPINYSIDTRTNNINAVFTLQTNITANTNKSIYMYYRNYKAVYNQTVVGFQGEGNYTGFNFASGNGPVGITNNGTYFWITHTTGTQVTKHNMSGSYISDFILNAGNTVPYGITTNNTDIWVADYSGGTIYHYLTDGTYINRFDTNLSGNAQPLGITTNNTYIWITDDNDNLVYKYYMNGTYTNENFSTIASIQSISYYENYLYVTSIANTEAYRLYMNGTPTDFSFDTATSGNTVPYGITQDGTYYWIVDNSDNLVYQYNQSFVTHSPLTFSSEQKNFEYYNESTTNISHYFSPSIVWYDNSWSKRKLINLTETSGSTLYNYSISIPINWSTGMNPDFSDLVPVINSNQILEYWIEDGYINNSNGTIWIKIPQLNANSNYSFYIYYDKPSRNDKGNISKVFMFGDDFNDDSIDANRWSGSVGTWAETGGKFDQSMTAGTIEYYSSTYTIANGIIEWSSTSYNYASNPARWQGATARGNGANNYYLVDVGYASDSLSMGVNFNNDLNKTADGNALTSYADNVYNRFRFKFSGSSLDFTYLNTSGNNLNLKATDTTYTTGKVGLVTYGDTKYDWFGVRGYSSSEPSIIINSEEANSDTNYNQIISYSRAWYDINWLKRKPFVIVEQSGTNLINYTLKFDINYTTEMNTDFSDIRFTSDTNLVLYSYWIERKTNGVNATVWVKIDSLPASQTKTIYMYYGNPIAISMSNINITPNLNPQLKSYWTFDQTTGNTILVDSIGLNNGTIHGGNFVTGLLGNAQLFNGTMTGGDGNDLGSWNTMQESQPNMTADKNFTFSFWYKSVATAGQYHMIYVNNAPTGIWLRFTDNKFGWFNGGFVVGTSSLPATANNGSWHHYVLVLGGTSSNALYFDGQPLVLDANSSRNNDNNGHFDMCRRASDEKYYCNGTLDEFGIWERVLSTSEVTQLYNSGNGITFKGDEIPEQEPTITENAIQTPRDVATVLNITVSSDVWASDSSTYRQKYYVYETSGSNLNNYSVKLNINWQTSMQTDFDDLRFYNGINQLPYWIEDKNDGISAKVWIKMNLIANENKLINVYYGNSTAISQSNISQTFLFGDDFNDDSIDTGKWNTGTSAGTWTETGGKMVQSDVAGSIVRMYSYFTIDNGIIEWNSTSLAGNPARWMAVFSRGTTGDTYYLAGSGYASDSLNIGDGFSQSISSTYDNNAVNIYADNIYNRFNFKFGGSNFVLTYINDTIHTLNLTGTDSSRSTGYAGLVTYGQTSYDWYAVRNYSSSEPSITPSIIEVPSSVTGNSTLNLSLTYSDNIGIKNATVTVTELISNNIVVQTIITNFTNIFADTISIPVALVQGIYKWGAIIFDFGGNFYEINSEQFIVLGGQEASIFYMNVSLTSPVDYYNSTSSLITFNCNTTVTGTLLNGSNTTLWINGIENYTNSSGFIDLQLSFADGDNYNWTCTARDSNNTEWFAPETRYFNIDTTKPSLQIIYPQNLTYYVTDNVTDLNFSVSDIHLDSCWYSTDIGITNISTSCILNITGLSPSLGSNTWSVYANDTFGLISTTYVTFEVLNIVVPTVSITYPINNAIYLYQITNMNYTYTGGQDNCWYSLDDGITNVTTTCGTNIIGILSNEGYNNWSIWVNNSLGLAMNTTSFFVDSIFPTIDLIYPEDAHIYKNNMTNFIFNVYDEFNVSNVTLNLYNNTNNAILNQTLLIESFYNTTFNETMLLSEGYYKWNVIATDTYNHITYSSNYTFTIDTVSPHIDISYPVIYANYSTNVTHLDFTITHDFGILDSCWYSLDNSITNVTFNCNLTTITGITSLEGYNNWTVCANDSVSDVGCHTHPFIMDTQNPLISIISPANNTKQSGTGFTIDVSASDLTERNITFYLYNRSFIEPKDRNSSAYYQSFSVGFPAVPFVNLNYFNDSNYETYFEFYDTNQMYVNNLSFQLTTNEPTNLNFYWKYEIINASGGDLSFSSFDCYNYTSNAWVFFIYYYDFTNGNHTATASLPNDCVSSDYKVTIRNTGGLYKTSYIHIYNYEIWLNYTGANFNPIQTDTYTNATRSKSYSGLPEDYYFYKASIRDQFNRINTTETRKITLDNTAPTGTSGGITTPSYSGGGGTSPYNNTYTNVASQNFTVNASDVMNGSGTGIANVTFIVKNQTDDVVYTETVNTNEQPNIFLGIAYLLWYEGVYKFYFSIYDVVGNWFNTAEAMITYDTIAPSGYITYPLNTTYNTAVTHIAYTVAEVNPNNCWYSVDEGVTNYSTTCGVNITGLSANEGNNAWSVYLNDSAGNINTSTVYFTKDTTAPIITINQPIPYHIYNSTTAIPLNISTNEPATILYSTAYVNNSLYTIPLNIALPIGTNLIIINATDNFGNSRLANITVGVDIDPPTVNLSPIPNASTDSFPKNITINYSIENYNLSRCWYQEGSYIQNNFTDGLTSGNMTYQTNYFGNDSRDFGASSSLPSEFEYCVVMTTPISGRLNISWSSPFGYGTSAGQWKLPAIIVVRDINRTILEELVDFEKDYQVQTEGIYKAGTEYGFCLRSIRQGGNPAVSFDTSTVGTTFKHYTVYSYNNSYNLSNSVGIGITVDTAPATKLLKIPSGTTLDEGFVTLTGTLNTTYNATPSNVYLTIGDHTILNDNAPDWYNTYYQVDETASSTSESASGYFNLGKEYDGNWSTYLSGIGSLVQTYTASVNEVYTIPVWNNRSVWEFKYSLFDNISACIDEYFNVTCYNGTGNQLIYSQNNGDNVLGDRLVSISIPDSCNVSGVLNITTKTSTGQGTGGDCVARYYEGQVRYWNSTNPFSSTITTDSLANKINNYLSTCNYNDGYCYVPLNFWSNGGILQYSNLKFSDGVYGDIPCPSGSTIYQNQTVIPFWMGGSHTVTIYGQDNVNLINSDSKTFFLQYHQYTQNAESDVVVEGEDVTFTLEVNMTLPSNTNATLVWNGINYSAQTYSIVGNKSIFTVTLSIPANSGNTSGVPINWYWKYDIMGYMTNEGIYQTSPQIQNVFSVVFDDCSVFTERILHFDLNDETPDTIMSSNNSPIIEAGVTLSSLNDGSVRFIYNNTFYNNNVSICIPSYVLNRTSYRMSATASYIASNYVQEFWFMDNGLLQKNSSNLDVWTGKNVTLRDLLTTDSTTFLFRFFDQDYIKQPNAIVTVLRDYIGNGVFKEVERAKMDDNGETHVHLIQEDVIYKFRVTLNGALLYESSTYNAKCLEQPCVISLQATQGSEGFDTNPYQLPTGTYQFNIQNENRTVEVGYNMNTTATMDLIVYEYNYDTNQQVVIGSDSETAQTGVLSVFVPASIGNKTYYAMLKYNGDAVTTEYLDLRQSGRTYFGVFGLLIAGLLILTLGLIAVSQGGWTILFLLLGVIISVIAGFLDLSMYWLMWLVATGMILVWKLASRRSI